MQAVPCDLDNFLYWIQTEAGHCFGSVQFRSSLDGASQTLMSMQSGGLASHRGPISPVGSVTAPPRHQRALAWWITLSPGSGLWNTGFWNRPHLCSPWLLHALWPQSWVAGEAKSPTSVYCSYCNTDIPQIYVTHGIINNWICFDIKIFLFTEFFNQYWQTRKGSRVWNIKVW